MAELDLVEIAQQMTDPLDKFPTATDASLIAACGLILGWAREAIAEAYLDEVPPSSVAALLTSRYAYPTHDYYNEKCSINADGVYSYPDDPDMYPMVKIHSPEVGVTIFIYQHSLVAVRTDTEVRLYRMD